MLVFFVGTNFKGFQWKMAIIGSYFSKFDMPNLAFVQSGSGSNLLTCMCVIVSISTKRSNRLQIFKQPQVEKDVEIGCSPF